MCKAPLSAILCLPLECHLRGNLSVLPRHTGTSSICSPKAAEHSGGETSCSTLTFWELKQGSGTHSHITSPLTRFTVRVSSEYAAFQPFLESTLGRVSAGARQGSSAGHAGGAQFCTKQTRTCHCTATATSETSGKLKA